MSDDLSATLLDLAPLYLGLVRVVAIFCRDIC